MVYLRYKSSVGGIPKIQVGGIPKIQVGGIPKIQVECRWYT